MKPKRSDLLSVFLFVVALPNLSSSTAATQDAGTTIHLKPSRRVSGDTKFVSCFAKGQPISSHVVRSPVLISPNGNRRAYVEVEAMAFRPSNESPDSEFSCENASRLFLSGREPDEFRVAYSQAPPDVSDGNSLRLVDWSADGTSVLMERTIWGYETEGEFTDFVVFDLKSGKTTIPDLTKVLGARYGKDCGSDNSVLGFTSHDDIAIFVSPLPDTFYNDGAVSCVKHRTAVALDAARSWQGVAQELPPDFKAQHFGHFSQKR